MRAKILISVCSMLIGAGAMLLLMSGLLAVVRAECPGEPGRPCGNGDVNGDGAINLADAVYILQYLFADGPNLVEDDWCCLPQPPSSLPATGQTKCYDADTNEIGCNSAEFPGQDGFCQTGCPVEERFVDNGDGTVTDNCTGLMWQQATAPGIYMWQEALQYCESLVLAGHDDWRLPNVKELQSIVDYGRDEPAIDPVFVAESRSYWSSSSDVEFIALAWYVHFMVGGVSNNDKGSDAYVRAVRGTP